MKEKFIQFLEEEKIKEEYIELLHRPLEEFLEENYSSNWIVSAFGWYDKKWSILNNKWCRIILDHTRENAPNVKKRLVRFLREEGRYDQFIHKYYRRNPEVPILTFVGDTFTENLISSVFIWDDHYWGELHRKWQTICKSL